MSSTHENGMESGNKVTRRQCRLTVMAMLTSSLMMAFAHPALAFSFLGITLFEDQQRADALAVIADPQNYTIAVRVDPENETLAADVQNASALWRGREKPASGAAGLLAIARADYRRIVAALYGQGHYGGTVSILVDGQQANDVAPDAQLAEPALVEIVVKPGPVFHFGKVTIINQAGLILNQDDPDFVSNDHGLVAGDIAQSGAIKRAARLAVEAWRQLGYAKAKISQQDIIADHKNQLLDVVLSVQPGPKTVLGAISIEGTADMDADFVVQQTGLKPGQEYDPDDFEQAKKRLAALDVFGAISIKEADSVGPEGSLPITVIVQERKLRRAGVGATFSSTDGLGVEGFWQHRNLFGGAEHLKLEAKLAGIGFPVNSADFDYYFGGTFRKPGIITPDSDLIVSANAQHTVLPRYTQTSAVGRIGLSQKFTPQLSGDVGVGAQRATFRDALYGARDFTVWSTFGGLTFDSRNDPSNATQGVFATVAAEPFYESENGNLAILLETEARSYWGFGADEQFVLAGRLKLGLLVGPTLAQTPPDKLFFAGGGGSVRGYSYRSIGVDSAAGVTGGQFLTEASVEARVKVTPNIGLVGFMDAGYVAADQFVGFAEGTRVGVGAGLRYNTGFGPIRLDVAVPLNKRAGDPDYGIYVGIGQAF